MYPARWKRIIVAITAIAALVVLPSCAWAALSASAVESTNVTSSVWGAFAAKSLTDSPNAAGLTLALPNKVLGDFFYIKNSGTRNLASVTVTFSAPGINGSHELLVQRCSGTWQTSTGGCLSGVITTLATLNAVTSSVTYTSLPLPLVVGDVLMLRALPSKVGAILHVNVSVALADTSGN